MQDEHVQGNTKGEASVDWGHAVFLGLMAAGIIWYLQDSISVSTDINNLLVVAPLSVVALILCIVIVPQTIRRLGQEAKGRSGGIKEMGADQIRSTEFRQLASIGAVGAALGVYVLMLTYIGFDIATWVFIAVVMVICGERRPLPLIIFPLVCAVVLILGFRWLLPYPMYTVIL